MNFSDLVLMISKKSKNWKYGHEPKECKRRAIALVKKFGIQTRKTLNDYQWDGKSLWIGNNSSNILHDLAHYCVASKIRRNLPDFGLGAGQESVKSANKKIGGEANSREEETASALGICFEYYLDLNSAATYEYHNWEGNSEKFCTKLEKFYNEGFLTEICKPTFKIR